MKKVLLTVLSIMAFTAMCAQETNSLSLSYNDEGSTGAIGASEKDMNIAAVEFTSDFLAPYVGCRITAIQYQLGASFGADGSVFITHDLNEGTNSRYAMEYNIPDFDYVPCYQWLDLTLPEPLTIEAGKSYIAGIRIMPYTGGKYYGSYQFAVNESVEGHAHSYMYDPSKQAWKPLSQYYFPPENEVEYTNTHFLIKLLVEGESLPSNDVAVTSVKSVDYLRTSETCSCTYTFKNMAANDVKSLESVLIVDGKEVQRNAFLLTKPIATGEEAEDSFEGIQFDGEGTHTLEVRVEKVNGEEDPHPADNSASKKVSVIDRYFKHNTFVEAFTTMSCANCPQAHDRENEALHGLADVVRVDHHSGFGADVLTTPLDQTLLWFYNNMGITYAPAIMFDRAMVDYFYDPQRGRGEENTPVIGPGSVEDIRYIHNYLGAEPAYVNVQIAPEYNPATRELKVTVSGEQIAHLAGNDVRLNVWLTESGLSAAENKKYGQMTGSGNYDYTFVHDHVMRATLTDNWGVAYTNEIGTYSQTFTTTVKEGWMSENMEVVAFVANYDPSNPTNCRVYNAAKSSLQGSIEGIDSVVADSLPTTVVPLYNLQGTQVRQMGSIKGVYISGGKKVIR